MLSAILKDYFRRAPVAKKITIVTMVTSTVTLILLSAGFFYTNWSLFKNQQTMRLDTMASIISSSTEAALIFNDQATANEYLSQLSQEKDLDVAILLDNRGEIFASFSRGNLRVPLSKWEAFDGIKWGRSGLSIRKPVTVNERRYGTIYLQMNNQTMTTFLQKSLGSAGLLLIGTMFLIHRLTTKFSRTLTAPIHSLSKIAKEVSETNDYSKKALVVYEDEVGSLLTSFNTMLERIEERDHKLKKSRDMLEEQVKLRTKELEAVNASLRTAIDDARAASKAKSNFLSVMSHELRTPMNAIIGMSTLLKDEVFNEGAKESIAIIQKSSQSLLRLVDDILDYSKIEAGRIEIEEIEFDLYQCLTDPMVIAAAQTERTDLCLLTKYSKKLPQIAVGDPTRLSQIVTNLLSNAIKFTKRGKVELNIERKEIEDQSYLSLDVIDTGIGIPADRLSRLFNEFSQVDTSTTRRYGGTGLGLAISQRLAGAMNGEIKVDSIEGLGTTFTLEIPLIMDDQAGSFLEIFHLEPSASFTLIGFEEPFRSGILSVADSIGIRYNEPDNVCSKTIRLINGTNSSPEEIATLIKNISNTLPLTHNVVVCEVSRANDFKKELGCQTLNLPIMPDRFAALFGTIARPSFESSKIIEASSENALKILLAEDNEINQRVFTRMLKKTNHDIEIVKNGIETIDAVKKNTYDIIFMDYMMPIMNGLEATEWIRANTSLQQQPHIIALTADVESGTSTKLLKAGMDDFLTKPLKSDELLNAIERFYSR